MVPEEGSTIGRLDSENGDMGVSKNAETVGSSIGDPKAAEYAVEPVGVETITPSPVYSPNVIPLKPTSIFTSFQKLEPETTMSFNASNCIMSLPFLAIVALSIIRLYIEE